MSEGRRYKILAVLGQGGFGTVYAAELMGEGGFTRKVALKVLNPDMAGVEDVANRLRDEARLLGMLRHRSIVQVDGLVMLNDRWTVVMEFIEGADLQKVVRNAGPLPFGPALEIISEAASALDVAYHTPTPKGVPMHLIHRDIKPPNILLTSAGETKVLDFGIARADFGGREAQTKSVLYGSLGYMAPERMEFEELPAGDVYALGTVLYELLDGQPLGKGSINPQKHQTLVAESVERLMKKRPELPKEFDDLIRSMLSYYPEERPNAREVERRCRQLRGHVEDIWLRDWAEKIIPPLQSKTSEMKSDDFSGQIVAERSSRLDPPASGVLSEGGPAPVVAPPPEAAKKPQTAPIRPPPPSSGGGTFFRIVMLSGCLLVVLVAAGTLVFGSVLTAGGVVAAASMAGRSGDTGHPVVVDPNNANNGNNGNNGSTDPDPDPDVGNFNIGDLVPDANGTDTNNKTNPMLFQMRTDVTEPWKSYNLPITNDMAVTYSDNTTLAIMVPVTDPKKLCKGFLDKMLSNGWKKQYEMTASGAFTWTMSRDGSNGTLSCMSIDGATMVSMSSY
jgi:serine/threonine protein kinase